MSSGQATAVEGRAALLWEAGPWSVETIEIREPTGREILVRIAAAGLCGSDLGLTQGKYAAAYPIVGGHEGAGVVTAVGPDVQDIGVGDHVVTVPVPNCGVCRYCTRGQPNLCDLVAFSAKGRWPGADAPGRCRGQAVGAFCLIGAFSEYAVINRVSVVKIDKDIPLDKAAIVGCGVMTGWCSSVRAAGIQIGDTAVILGVGGVGMAAVQGAAHAGAETIIAVDPVSSKRERAMEFGATHAAPTLEEAATLVAELTDGRMADAVNVTVGSITGEIVGEALEMVSKGGRVVLTGGAPPGKIDVSMNVAGLHSGQKHLSGTLLGNAQPGIDIPRLLRLYQRGELLLDEMISTTYPLDQINRGYEDLAAGRNIRGVLAFE